MQYEVVIVGAGPAGATAAKCLAEKNINVLLLDKDTFPRDKPCGGGLTTRVMKRYPYVNNLLDSISYASTTHSSSFKYQFSIRRDKPLIGMVTRKKFDSALLKKAVDAGATFQANKNVVDIKISKEKATLLLDDKTKIDTKMVLACDGIRSIIAKKTHLNPDQQNLCICVVQEQPLQQKQIDTYFTKKLDVHVFIKILGIAGYGWIFPKQGMINLGLGEFEPAINPTKAKSNLKKIYNQFVDELKKQKLLPPDFPIENVRGGVLPVFPLEKTYTDRVLLCGDAAGFINPITGEGIYYAMVSGEYAADVVEEAINKNDFSSQILERYQRLWKHDFGKDLKYLGEFNKYWGRSTEKLVRLLERDRTLGKLTVGVTGGQLSFAKYRHYLMFRYLYASLKDYLIKYEKN